MSIKYHSHIQLPDSNEIKLGTSSDLRLYHDGSNSYINDSGTGVLVIASSQTNMQVGGANKLIVGTNEVTLLDNIALDLGTSGDFNIVHNGTNTEIENLTGNLNIKQQTNDGDINFFCDDGSGGVTTYLTLDGSAGYTTVQKDIRFNDDVELLFGTDSDFKIKHNGSNGFIRNFLGDLYVLNAANDKDIIFQNDDGSGGTTTYFKLDGSSASSGTLYTQFPDNSNLTFGSADDLQIKHDGTDSKITNSTGDLVIRNLADDKDIIFQSDDGSGGTATYITIDGDNTLTEFSKGAQFASGSYVKLLDGVISYFGTGNDLQIYHDGSNNYIQASGTGDIIIEQRNNDKDIVFNCDDGSGGIATYFRLDGSASSGAGFTVFPDSSTLAIGDGYDMRFQHNGTNSYILNYTGNIEIEQNADDKDIILKADDGSGGTTAYLTLDGSQGFTTAQKAIRFDDTIPLQLGSGADLRIYHNGTTSNNNIENHTGDLYVTQYVDDGDIIFRSDDGSGDVTEYFRVDGGAAIIGVSREMRFFDNVPVKLGTGPDFQMLHNGSSTSFENSTGNFLITNLADDGDLIFKCDNGSGGTTTYLALDGGITSILAYKDILMANDGDGGKLKLGASQDFQIYHDGSNSTIDNYTGNIDIINRQDNGDVRFFSDDGSGGTTEYFRVDGGQEKILFSKNSEHQDSVKGQFGNSGDFSLYHNGTDSYIENDTGDLYIRNNVNDKDIIFQSDDGSGGVATYFFLDGSTSSTVVPDSKYLYFGSGHDMRLYFDGTDGYIQSIAGDMIIRQSADDKDILFQCDDGSGGVTSYLTLDGSAGYTTVQKNMRFNDSTFLEVGASADLSLYHDGTDSYIKNSVGDLYIRNDADDKDIIFAGDDGSGGVTAYITLDGSAGYTTVQKNMRFANSVEVELGTNGNLTLEHNGTNGFITEATGDLTIKNTANDKDIIFQSDDNSGGVETYFFLDGSSSRTIFPDGKEAVFGTDSNLFLFHSTNSFIQNYTSGNFFIDQRVDDADLVLRADDGSGGTAAYLTLDGSATAITAHKNITSTGGDSVAPQFNLLHDGTNPSTNEELGVIQFQVDYDGSHQDWGKIRLDTNASAVRTNMEFYVKSTSGNEELALTLEGQASAVPNATFAGDILVNTATAGGYIQIDQSDDSLKLADANRLKIGTGNDFQLYHSGTNSFITNNTGDINIINHVDNADIKFQADDGSGGDTEYFRLDGSEGRLVHSVNSRYLDNVVAMFGAGADLQILSDGNDGFINNVTNHLYITNSANDCDLVLRSDDGSGGVTAYLTLDGGAGFTIADKKIRYKDNVEAAFGSSDDMMLKHDGTDGFIQNYTGDLYIRNNTNDKDIVFQSDDGSGGNASYFRLDGSQVETRFHKATLHLDSVKAKYGDSGDLQIQHNGTDSQITNSTGHLQFTNLANNSDISFASDDGAGNDTIYFSVDGGAAEHNGSATTALYTIWPDNSRVAIGTSKDLQLDHNGTDSVIRNETGDLYIMNKADDKDLIFKCDDNSGGVAEYFRLDGSSKLNVFSQHVRVEDSIMFQCGGGNDLRTYHDGSNSYMENHTGDMYFMQRADNGDMFFTCDDGSGSDSTYFYLDGGVADGTNKVTRFPDQSILVFGSGTTFQDGMQIYHNGTNSFVNNYVGNFEIRQEANDADLIFKCDDGSGGITEYFRLDGSEGYSIASKHIMLEDNVELRVGGGADLKLYHGGTDSYIINATNDLEIICTGDDIIMKAADDFLVQTQSSENAIYAQGNGKVELFHNNVSKFETTSTGAKVSGELTIEGTVDQILNLKSTDDGPVYHAYLRGTDRHAYVGFGGSNDAFSIVNEETDGDIIFQADGGSGSVTSYFMLDGGLVKNRFFIDVLHNDNVKALFGTGSDLEIYHDGSNSYINHSGTGNLSIGTSGNAQVLLSNDDVTLSDNLILSSAAGQVQFTGTSGGGNEGITYKDAGGGNRYGLLFPGSDVVALANRASNGTVQIRANTSTAGSGGEVTVAEFEDSLIKLNKPVQVARAATPSDGDIPANSGIIYLDSNFDLKIKINGSEGVVTRTLAQYEE
jgi:hypothetical protein